MNECSENSLLAVQRNSLALILKRQGAFMINGEELLRAVFSSQNISIRMIYRAQFTHLSRNILYPAQKKIHVVSEMSFLTSEVTRLKMDLILFPQRTFITRIFLFLLLSSLLMSILFSFEGLLIHPQHPHSWRTRLSLSV